QAFDQELLDVLLDHIEEFVTGARPRRDPDHMPADGDGSADAIAELERYREILAAGKDEAGLAGLVARAEAVVAAARGSWSEAEAQFSKAAETFRRQGMVWQEAQTFQTWGRALEASPDRRGALEKLEKAIEIHRRQGSEHVAMQHVPAGDGGAPP